MVRLPPSDQRSGRRRWRSGRYECSRFVKCCGCGCAGEGVRATERLAGVDRKTLVADQVQPHRVSGIADQAGGRPTMSRPSTRSSTSRLVPRLALVRLRGEHGPRMGHQGRLGRAVHLIRPRGRAVQHVCLRRSLTGQVAGAGVCAGPDAAPGVGLRTRAGLLLRRCWRAAISGWPAGEPWGSQMPRPARPKNPSVTMPVAPISRVDPPVRGLDPPAPGWPAAGSAGTRSRGPPRATGRARSRGYRRAAAGRGRRS